MFSRILCGCSGACYLISELYCRRQPIKGADGERLDGTEPYAHDRALGALQRFRNGDGRMFRRFRRLSPRSTCSEGGIVGIWGAGVGSRS